MIPFPLLLLLCGLANALKSPMGVASLFSVIPKANTKNSSSSGRLELPPIEVLVKLDFDVSTRHKKEKKTGSPPPPKAPAPSKKVVHKRPPSPPHKVKKAFVPPPPPKKKVVALEKQAKRSLPQRVMAPQPKPPSKNVLLSMQGTKPKVGAVSTRSTQDKKIANVVWATLLLVMMDLLLFCNTDLGKDFLIGSLDSMPEQVPVQLLVWAISDGLLLGIFAVGLVATVGPFFAEVTR